MTQAEEKLDDYEDGMYFGLSDDVYHQIPALSSSGIKNLLISPVDFYMRCPWLSPSYQEDKEESEALFIGRAFHKRICEGKKAFDDTYVPEFEPPEGSLRTGDELKAACKELGLPVSGTKATLIDRIADHPLGGSYQIYDQLKSEFESANEGKEQISFDLLTRIEVANAMIEKNTELSKCFRGGLPEVSIVWSGHGVRYKVRFDFLKPKSFTDLKTFANKMRKPIDDAIYYSMACEKYHVQFALYLLGADRAIEFAQQGKVYIPENYETKYPIVSPFLEEIAKTEKEAMGCYAVFQQKGIAPLARGKKFERGSMFWNGVHAVEDATAIFKKNMGHFGTSQWVDTTPIEAFSDEKFPPFAIYTVME